jgi:hypothetical protein
MVRRCACCARAASGQAAAPPMSLMTSIELHLLPQPGTLRHHTGLARIKAGLAAVRDFDPAYVTPGQQGRFCLVRAARS